MSDTEAILTALRSRYLAYREKVEEVERSSKPAAGLLGLKGGVKDDPCHDAFAEDLRVLLADFAAAEPDSAAVSRVLRFMFRYPLENPKPSCAYWMLLAVQTLAQDLIELLTPEDAAALAAEYKRDYPRRMRFPAQEQLLKKLKRRAG